VAPVDLPAYRERWAELVRLGAPVSASSLTGSVMGATDILIAAAISPAAVAVVTVADLYRQLVGRVGGGVGGELDPAAVADGAGYLAATLVVAPLTLPKGTCSRSYAEVPTVSSGHRTPRLPSRWSRSACPSPPVGSSPASHCFPSAGS
jgi:hypothetical protein